MQINIRVSIISLLESVSKVSRIVHVIKISQSIKAIDLKNMMFLFMTDCKYSASTILLSNLSQTLLKL